MYTTVTCTCAGPEGLTTWLNIPYCIILTLFYQLSVFSAEKFLFGQPCKWIALPSTGIVLSLLIVACPNVTEFWVLWTMRYVGLFAVVAVWPFAPRSWLKWFSTVSWLIIAVLMNNPEKRATFDFIMDMKPSIMDCRSNQDLSLRNPLDDEMLDFQFLK